MAPEKRQPFDSAGVWALAERQHGPVAHRQLLALGLSPDAIRHRVARGRLHPKARGVYAVGRPELSRSGELMVAVLTCRGRVGVSHGTATELWGVRRPDPGPVHLSVPGTAPHRRPGVVVHRRRVLTPERIVVRHGIPVTALPLTLVDVAAQGLPDRQLEAAINQTDALDLLDPPALRAELNALAGQAGVARLRALLDRHTFRLTDSELERMFLRLVRRAGLPDPQTQRYASGWRVDFLWPDLGLVVETDSLRYHRTPAQQNRDYGPTPAVVALTGPGPRQNDNRCVWPAAAPPAATSSAPGSTPSRRGRTARGRSTCGS